MIKKVVHLADVHIRLFKRHDEYREQFEKFYSECRKHNPDRIVIAGDLVHSKNELTPELIQMVMEFLTKCSEISKTIITLGNHDFLANNLDRLDALTPIINTMNNPNIVFLRETGCYEDDNVVWCVYSQLTGSDRPDIEKARLKCGDEKTYIGLYHDPIQKSKSAMGFEFEDAQDVNIFDGTDLCMMGDIHLQQNFKYKTGTAVYAGSFLQQDYGEMVNDHGYVLWDIETRKFEFMKIPSDYGFYTFKISSIDDLEEGNEKLVNII